MSAIYILWLREVRRYTRVKFQIIASVAQASMYLIALGFGLGGVFRQAGRGSYIQFVAPGVIAMTVLFSAMFSGVAVMWDRQFGFLKETLVAPVSRVYLMFGRTLGAATSAMLQGLLVAAVCVIAGFRPDHLALVPMGIAFMLLMAIVFAALGTTIGTMIENTESLQMVMNFLVMPLFFLSGALYPLDGLSGPMKVATRLDPMTYGVDGLRATLISQPFFGYGLDVAVLAPLAAVFICLGAWRFSKIQI